MKELLRTKVIDLNLSCRLTKCLTENNINTLGDVTSMYKHDFLKLRNFGKVTLKELSETIYALELKFKGE